MIEDTVAVGRRSTVAADGPLGERPRRRGWIPAVVVVLTIGLTLVLAACGDGGGSSGVDVTTASSETTAAKKDLPDVEASKYKDETGKATVEIDAVDNAFQSKYTKVSKGTQVVFTNKGAVPHNVVPVTKGQFEEIPANGFAPGTQVTLTLTEAGTYPYYCSLHGTARLGMNGRIVVAE